MASYWNASWVTELIWMHVPNDELNPYVGVSECLVSSEGDELRMAVQIHHHFIFPLNLAL